MPEEANTKRRSLSCPCDLGSRGRDWTTEGSLACARQQWYVGEQLIILPSPLISARLFTVLVNEPGRSHIFFFDLHFIGLEMNSLGFDWFHRRGSAFYVQIVVYSSVHGEPRGWGAFAVKHGAAQYNLCIYVWEENWASPLRTSLDRKKKNLSCAPFFFFLNEQPDKTTAV